MCEETRVLLRVLTRESKADVGKYKAARWQSFLTTIQATHDKTDRAFWTHLSARNTVLSTRQEITDELSQYYSEQFRAPLIHYSDAHDVKIETEYNELLNKLWMTDKRVDETSTAEISRLIKMLKQKTSAGFDLVSNLMIKKLPPSYIDCLAKCFNIWLRECRYPDEWKLAKIVP